MQLWSGREGGGHAWAPSAPFRLGGGHGWRRGGCRSPPCSQAASRPCSPSPSTASRGGGHRTCLPASTPTAVAQPTCSPTPPAASSTPCLQACWVHAHARARPPAHPRHARNPAHLRDRVPPVHERELLAVLELARVRLVQPDRRAAHAGLLARGLVLLVPRQRHHLQAGGAWCVCARGRMRGWGPALGDSSFGTGCWVEEQRACRTWVGGAGREGRQAGGHLHAPAPRRTSGSAGPLVSVTGTRPFVSTAV